MFDVCVGSGEVVVVTHNFPGVPVAVPAEKTSPHTHTQDFHFYG